MIANSLVVNGAARFLNKIYANDLQVSGTTSFTDLSVSGTSSFTGKATFNGHVAIGGYNNTSTNGTLSTHGLYTNEWLRSVGSVGWYSQTYGGGIYMKDTTYVRTYNNKSFFVENGNLYVGTTSNSWSSSGNLVTSTIKATSAQLDNLQVNDTLRSFKWDIDHVANLGGNFLVTPTYNATENSATFAVNSISGTTITATINDSTAISGSTLGGVTWAKDSKIKITGKIGGIVLPICEGKLTNQLNNSSGAMNIQFTYPNQSSNSLSAKTYGASEVSGLTVMLLTIGATNPIGIYMTARDSNNYSHISLYGGTDTKPVVRIGNLQGLDPVGGVDPDDSIVTNKWGIYTYNGFFKGVIAAERGVIGSNTTVTNNWQIGDRSIWYGNKTPGASTTALVISTGTSSINSIAGSGTGSKTWMIAAGTGFGVTNTGVMYATGAHVSGEITAESGTIGGASISNGVLQIKEANISGTISGSKITATSISADRLNITDLQAIGASIGGFAIDTTSIHTKNIAVTSNADNSIALSSADFTRTINSTSRAGLRFAIGDKFGVTGDGAIYASSATISGSITATSGTIGGWTANSSYGLYTNSKTTDKSTNTGILIQKDGGIYAGAYNSTNGSCPFQVTNAGVLTAISGTIGGWTIGTTSLYNNKSSFNNSNEGIYIGIDYIAGGAGEEWWLKKDGSAKIGALTLSAAGVLAVPAANITGTLSADRIAAGSLELGKLTTTAQTTISDAAKTATNYLTYNSSNGLTIGYSGSNTKSIINSNGMEIFNGSNSSVAFFGLENNKTVCRVGTTGEGNIVMTAGGVDIRYRNSNVSHIGYAEDVIDANGRAISGSYFSFGPNARTEGQLIGQLSLVHGLGNKGNGYCSFISNGWLCEAVGVYSHAEGLQSKTTEYGVYSHAEGVQTEAAGVAAHVEGSASKASGNSAHAQNIGTIASGEGQTAIGRYNIEDENLYSFIIGNGEDKNNRSNAFTVDWGGTGTFSGDVYLAKNGYGYYLKDGAGNSYPGLRDNSANLWIGATSTAAKHHVGGTYISTGYDATNNKGYETIKISVPNSTNTNATNYNVWHSGNLNLSVDSNGNTTFPGVVKQSKPVITLTRTSNSYVDATSFARMTATQVGNLIVIYGNLRLTTSLPTTTSADLIQIGTIGCSESIMQGAAVMVPSGNGQPVLIQIGTDKKISIYNYGSSAATGWIRFSATIVINN